MSELINCNACEDLREYAPEFVQKGVTDTVCNSMKNDTGINPTATVTHTDCEDLNTVNDCLVGRMDDELEAYDSCDWKKFMHKFIPNLYTLLKLMICSICGLWVNVHLLWAEIDKLWAEINALKTRVTNLENRMTVVENAIKTINNAISNINTQIANILSKLNVASYVGILTLYSSYKNTWTGSLTGNQTPAFNTNVRQGNMPTSVLSVTSDYKGITVSNTTSVPLLVDCTFNSSIYTDQHLCSCFIVVTRDGTTIGQTPFITPNTYDQQVRAESFVLQPGASSTLRYYFRIGDANAWFLSKFGKEDSVGECRCVLDANDSSNPENQRSYFTVKVTSIVDQG